MSPNHFNVTDPAAYRKFLDAIETLRSIDDPTDDSPTNCDEAISLLLAIRQHHATTNSNDADAAHDTDEDHFDLDTENTLADLDEHLDHLEENWGAGGVIISTEIFAEHLADASPQALAHHHRRFNRQIERRSAALSVSTDIVTGVKVSRLEGLRNHLREQLAKHGMEWEQDCLEKEKEARRMREQAAWSSSTEESLDGYESDDEDEENYDTIDESESSTHQGSPVRGDVADANGAGEEHGSTQIRDEAGDDTGIDEDSNDEGDSATSESGSTPEKRHNHAREPTIAVEDNREAILDDSSEDGEGGQRTPESDTDEDESLGKIASSTHRPSTPAEGVGATVPVGNALDLSALQQNLLDGRIAAGGDAAAAADADDEDDDDDELSSAGGESDTPGGWEPIFAGFERSRKLE